MTTEYKEYLEQLKRHDEIFLQVIQPDELCMFKTFPIRSYMTQNNDGHYEYQCRSGVLTIYFMRVNTDDSLFTYRLFDENYDAYRYQGGIWVQRKSIDSIINQSDLGKLISKIKTRIQNDEDLFVGYMQSVKDERELNIVLNNKQESNEQIVKKVSRL